MSEPTRVNGGRLTGRVAIVTGASANIGGAQVLGLAEEGARVVCTDLSAETAHVSAARSTDAGGETLVAVGAVTDENHAPAVVEALPFDDPPPEH